ncbi:MULTISPECIES: CcoQ/FixQ family Cbb3-type cytochrome c oxidase assembly chaperone [Colwellia]|uniref:Cytochrome oxidase n=1 Tax=Colwellia marinimaniae TaxID=1513592 RepID=A0ABQ0MYF7_9GAMM|nr:MULTISPECIES: CcoQ/FixQ family Cbb3-type cytochrome c oxidase assembly chaperone [Colwellia]GAW97282.1 cytochrome oxidase [Colwellia marinimaniae]
MDYGTLRGLVALLIFALFIIIVLWSYSNKRSAAFEDIANSIFEEDELSKKIKQSHLDTNNNQETNNV